MDMQGLTLGHPALDIWTIVYSATDPEYRATHLETDLQAYYTILTSYMEEAPDFTEFMQEVEERRVYGMVMFSKTSYYILHSSANCLFLLIRRLLFRHPESNSTAQPSQGALQVLCSV